MGGGQDVESRRTLILAVAAGLFVALLAATRRSQPVGRTDQLPQPPFDKSVAVLEYYSVPEAAVVANASAVVRGRVAGVSQPFWNQDSHARWEPTAAAVALAPVQTPRAFPMLLQEVAVAVSEVWRDREGVVGDPPTTLHFAVLGTGIGQTYNEEGLSLAPGNEVVLFLATRLFGWREGGVTPLLTLSGAYQGVYRVLAGGRVECAGEADPSLARSRSIADLRRAVNAAAKAAPGKGR